MAKPRMYGAQHFRNPRTDGDRWKRQQARKEAEEHIRNAPIQKAVFGGADPGCLMAVVARGLKR